jgi:hypothetical protein
MLPVMMGYFDARSSFSWSYQHGPAMTGNWQNAAVPIYPRDIPFMELMVCAQNDGTSTFILVFSIPYKYITVDFLYSEPMM